MKKPALWKGLAIAIVGYVLIYSTTLLWFEYTDRQAISNNGHVIQKCPDDYGTNDAGSAEYMAAMNKWTNAFYDSHPEATLEDWAEARHQFWIINNCTAALQRYKEYNEMKANPAASWSE